MWHFPDEGFGEADVPAPADGGVAAGEGDLPGDAAVGAFVAGLGGGEPRCSGRDECQGQLRLGGGARRFHAFQLGDLIDDFGVGGVVVDTGELVDPAGELVGGQRCVVTFDTVAIPRHVFDYSRLNWDEEECFYNWLQRYLAAGKVHDGRDPHRRRLRPVTANDGPDT